MAAPNIKAEYVDRAATTLRAMPADVDGEDDLRAEMHVRSQQAQMLADTQPLKPSPFFEWIEATALRSLDLARRLKVPMHEMRALGALIIAAHTASNTSKLTRHT